MKIRTLDRYKTKLLKLKLIKTKIYKNTKNLNYLILKSMETRLKKVLHIIYRFHIASKKILFIGTPLELGNKIKQLLKNKKHSFIPESVWVNGIITNSKPSFKYLLKQHAIINNNTSKFLFNLKNQTDLIVVLNEKLNLTALNESSLKRIPTITLNSCYNLLNFNLATYKVEGDYSFTRKTTRNNLFFLLLSSLFRKAELVKQKQTKNNIKQRKIRPTKKPKNFINIKKNGFQKKK